MSKKIHTTAQSHVLRLALLGDFDGRVAGVQILVAGYAKLRALLAFLAMSAGTSLQRDFLADLLWPGMPVAIARRNLRLALFNLKAAMGVSGELLTASRNAVTMTPLNSWLDVTEFVLPASGLAAMERQLALYRGEFMASFTLPDCPEFEGWLQIQREAMRRHALALLEQVSNCYTQNREYGKALPFARRYLELDPWNEPAHRRVMHLYERSGQNCAAISHYEAFCQMQKKELGGLPGEETRQLAERIRLGGIQHIPPENIQGERRQMTVLHCEISTDEIDDPDEAMALLAEPQGRCLEIIRKFSGHVVNTYGGGLLAYFGYPHAREDAARHAVQAALNITRLAPQNIGISAGVHTGIIIAGLDGSVPDLVGKITRTAIQLHQRAAHNEVVISQSTRHLIRGYFDCISLGVQAIPSVVQELELFHVLSESGARTRLEAADFLTPLVGRRREIAQLALLWEEASQGRSQVVLIQGDAGIGKSRLLHEMKALLADRPHAIRELRCFPEYSQSPFHPVIASLESIFGFDQTDTDEVKSVKLTQYLEAHQPAIAKDAVPLLSQLLSLPVPEPYQTAAMSPQQIKEQTIAVLIGMLQSLSEKQPVLLILEDLHWTDPSTLEFLTRFVEQKTSAPILAALTARPEFDPPWAEAFEATLELAHLENNEVAQLIASINQDAPAATYRCIMDRADGIPLFAEELAKIAALDNQACIPETLHDLLAVRMISLGDAKATAQLAASLGREFDLNLLRRASPCDTKALTRALIALQDAGMVLQVSETTFQFKHALMQEAAYQSQSRPDRQASHQRIAQTLRRDFHDIATTRPELLAHHFSSAGDAKSAIEYWAKAGQRAARRFANPEAIAHYDSALKLLATLPPEKARDRMEFDLCIDLGTTLIAAKGYGSSETAQTYRRALELSAQFDDTSKLFLALWGIWLNSISRVDHTRALQLAEKLLRLAQQGNDALQLLQANYAMANSLFWMGETDRSRIHLELALSLYQPFHHEAMVNQYGRNTCVLIHSLLSWALWLQGYPAQAEAADQKTLAVARQINHPFSLAYALSQSSILRRWMKQLEATEKLACEVMALSQKHGFIMGTVTGEAAHGWSLVMRGQANGVALIRQSLDTTRKTMNRSNISFFTTLIEAHAQQKQFDDALSAINEALSAANMGKGHFFESDLYRLKGECLLALFPAKGEEAEACFNRALALSRNQGARMLELRASMSMARLLQQQGKPDEAHRLLKNILGWFSEGFDTPDLLEGKSLLDSF